MKTFVSDIKELAGKTILAAGKNFEYLYLVFEDNSWWAAKAYCRDEFSEWEEIGVDVAMDNISENELIGLGVFTREEIETYNAERTRKHKQLMEKLERETLKQLVSKYGDPNSHA